MARSLSFRVEIDVRSIAREIDKEIANLRANTGLEGQLINNAVFQRNGEQVSLFKFLDVGTREHIIPPGSKGVLANEQADFIVSGSVRHPGTPPHDITSRTFSYFEQVFARKVSGVSTRALANRTGTQIDFDLVRQTFVDSMVLARDFAEKITPSNWASVKAGYDIRINKRRVQA